LLKDRRFTHRLWKEKNSRREGKSSTIKVQSDRHKWECWRKQKRLAGNYSFI